MNIFGLGTDLVNIKRIEKTLNLYGNNFKNKIFSKKEINYCDKKKNPSSYYAKRFAAKEAFTKALGIGISHGISLKNIEKNGKPTISLNGKVSKYLKKKLGRKKYFIHLSLTDDKPWAQATVIISYKQ